MVSPGRKRQGRVSRFKIGEFKYFSRLWGIGVVSYYLVSGHVVTRAGGMVALRVRASQSSLLGCGL